ncbi:MAG TPA: hypothetical protein VMV79_07805 [Alphaproteobacteria bacterium]|nr:hypothetical protein [Alphaproteobacteria bacterium]
MILPFAKRSPAQFILLLGDEGILCTPYRIAAAPPPFFTRTGNEHGVNAIHALLARYPQVPVALLIDTLEQDFRIDTLPRLNPFDRAALIKRRLQQAFPDAFLRAHLVQGGGRVLLAGVGNNGPLSAWLQRLERPGAAAPRFALLPVEAADLAARLAPAENGWSLLLSRQQAGGVRQIVARDGKLVFTRLTPSVPPDAGTGEIAQSVVRDLRATLGYLGRLGLSDSRQLAAAILAPPFLHDALRKAAPPLGTLNILSPRAAALQLDLPFFPEDGDPFGDALFVGWFARRKKLLMPLMTPDRRAARQGVLIRRWGWRAAVAALLLALVLGGWQTHDAFATIFKSRRAAYELAALRHELAEEQAATGSVTAPLGRLRAALERKRLFAAPQPAPWPLLAALARGLGGTARLVRLDWRYESAQEAENDKAKKDRPAGEILAIDLCLVPALDATASKDAIVAGFQHVATALATTLPGYTVAVTRFPFPALPQETLSNDGKTGADAPGDFTAAFMIQKATP